MAVVVIVAEGAGEGVARGTDEVQVAVKVVDVEIAGVVLIGQDFQGRPVHVPGPILSLVRVLALEIRMAQMDCRSNVQNLESISSSILLSP